MYSIPLYSFMSTNVCKFHFTKIIIVIIATIVIIAIIIIIVKYCHLYVDKCDKGISGF